MNPKIKYALIALAVFLLLWFGTHPDIAVSMFAAPLIGVGIGWLFDKLVS